MIVVSDASPIRALAHLNELRLLRDLFGEVFIPPAVAAELETPASTLTPVSLSPYAFVLVRDPRDRSLVDRLRKELDAGEAQAIALAIEAHAKTLLIDENKGRAAALR